MKFFLAVISFIILSFAIAYPWHLIWFHDLYVSWGAVTRKDPIVPLGILAVIIQASVIAYLFPFFKRGTILSLKGFYLAGSLALLFGLSWGQPLQQNST